MHIQKIFIIFLLFLLSCGSIDFPKPRGFADYEDKSSTYRAVTPEGVRLKVRFIKNESKATTSMWIQSINHQLQGKGYHRKLKRDISSSDGKKGMYAEYNYRHYGRNHSYFICIFAKKDKIYIIECGGLSKDYTLHKTALLDAVQKCKVDQ